jgi:hypothetical protein
MSAPSPARWGRTRPRVHQFPGFGGFSVTSPRGVRAIGLVVDDHHKALSRGIVASSAGVVRVAEPVVRGVEEPLEQH